MGGWSGAELTASLLISECSGPFMHFRQMGKELGLADHPIMAVNDAIFALVFTVARIVFGPPLVYLTIAAGSPLPVQIGGVGLMLVSAYWWILIVRMAARKLSGGKRPRGKKGMGAREASGLAHAS